MKLDPLKRSQHQPLGSGERHPRLVYEDHHPDPSRAGPRGDALGIAGESSTAVEKRDVLDDSGGNRLPGPLVHHGIGRDAWVVGYRHADSGIGPMTHQSRRVIGDAARPGGG